MQGLLRTGNRGLLIAMDGCAEALLEFLFVRWITTDMELRDSRNIDPA